MGSVTTPFDGLFASSQALIIIIFDVTMHPLDNPNIFTKFNMWILSMSPPSIKTHLILCLWTKSSRWRGSLWYGLCEGTSFLFNVAWCEVQDILPWLETSLHLCQWKLKSLIKLCLGLPYVVEIYAIA